ncbi:TPA: helix-turn-helix domain-containing protein [Escherichia coli]
MLEMFEKIEKKYWQDKIKKISKFGVIKMQDLDDAKVIEVLAKVLTKKGISKVKHNSYISKVLQITTSAGYKKLNGATKWEVQQLIKVVQSVGMDMIEFFRIYYEDNKEIQDAIWNDGRSEHSCKVCLYPEGSEVNTEYSALKVADQWNIFPTNDLKDELLYESKRSIESIVINPKVISSTKYRIALLDDDANITESLKEILSNDYYQVDTYDNLKKLTQAVATNPYDAYVLDWIIGDETSFKLVKAIRSSKNKNAMIIVLTGQLSGIKDDEIVKSIHDYDIVGPYEKPIKSGIIKSNIEKYFAR